jgi:putative tricarboxylic transport membrane protein
MFDQLLNGFQLAFQPHLLLINFLAVVGGFVIGALPGLTATMGVAVLAPLTFKLPPDEGFIILIAIFISAVQGGSVSAILINTPGTPAAAATVFDGYPMARKGLAGKAIGMAQTASFGGCLISWLFLITCSPLIAHMALKFSTPEYFAFAVFGLTIIGSLSAHSPLKGFIAGLFGLILAAVGLDPLDGIPRFTFGSQDLLGGISYVPALIGLFGIAEVFASVEQIGAAAVVIQKIKNVLPTREDLKKCFHLILGGGIIGTFIGALPGTGADIAAFVSYGEAKRWSRNPEKFGTGIIEGVAAPEAGNNGVCGGALIPMLTLGVPGDAVTAIILGLFIIRGLRPGPSLFAEHGDLVYTLFAGFLIAAIMTVTVGLSLARLFARVLTVPQRILPPIIFSLCLVGSYAIQNSIFDVYLAVFFGMLGYLMRKFGFHGSPIVLALILGPMAEYNFRLSLASSHGDFSIFLTRPIRLGLLILSVFSAAFPFWREYRAKRRRWVEKSE